MACNKFVMAVLIFAVTMLCAACSTAKLKYDSNGPLSQKYQNASFLDNLPTNDKDKVTLEKAGFQLGADLADSTTRSTTLKRPARFVHSGAVDVKLLTPADEIIQFVAETAGNKLLTREMRASELQKRLDAVSKDRTCFQVGLARTELVTKAVWGGELVEKGSAPVPLEFASTLACAKKAISWKQPFGLVLGAGAVQPDALGEVSWYFDKKNQIRPELHALPKSGELSVLELTEMRAKTIGNAIATNNLKWLKKELPAGQNLPISDRSILIGTIYAVAKENGDQCPTGAIDYLYEAGAIQSLDFYRAMDKASPGGEMYECIPYAKSAYLWAPELRSKIFATVHKQFVESLSVMSPSDSLAEINHRQKIVDFYKFIHRNLSAECVEGRNDLCVLLDASEKTMRAAAGRLTAHNLERERYQKIRALLEQIMRNEQQRQKRHDDFI